MAAVGATHQRRRPHDLRAGSLHLGASLYPARLVSRGLAHEHTDLGGPLGEDSRQRRPLSRLLPLGHRFDNKHYFGKRALVFYVELENVLDRANVADYLYDDGGDIDTVYQFRRFVVGGARFEF